jgi:hypothetical protein
MFNCRRILSVSTAAVLVLCAGLARADDQHVVSLTCRGMEVQKALGILQTVSDLRVVVDPKVPHKRITLSLKDLPAEDALKTVVAAAGLSYRKVGNAFVVESVDGRPGDKSRSGEAPQPGGPSTHPGAAAPGLGGGIVRPDQPEPSPGAAPPQAPVAVSPAVLAALEHTVDVDVKNGPLTEVMAQLSSSAGIKVTADPRLSAGLVATVGLHGIPLKSALELVAGQTGLQISPRPDGVAFVTPGFSLDAAQARARRAPKGAKLVEQGQLWTAEWANVLSGGFSAFDGTRAIRSLRRQSIHPDGRPIQFKPRSGGLHQLVPPAPTVAGSKRAFEKRRPTLPSAAAVKCPHCGRLVPVKTGFKCADCGRLLASGTLTCPACGGKPVRAGIPPARCPYCGQPLGNRRP